MLCDVDDNLTERDGIDALSDRNFKFANVVFAADF